jgi:FAD/FMN-containing dehydrogenase
MKAYLKDLSAKLLGTVTDNPDVLEHFSTDGSIFQVTPTAVVYPNNTADVRKTVEFAHERAVAGKPTSLVPRGKGGDLGGGAIGEGIQLVFPPHMHKLLRLESNYVIVQPGMTLRMLQQTLNTHGRYLPPVPNPQDLTTVGGAVANDDAGPSAYKHGSFRAFVRGLKVVLSDGSLIETRPLSPRELSRKKGLTTLEGDVYRGVDSLLLDHAETIRKSAPRTSKNTAGYALDRVRAKDKSFDLSQLFIGSQGTLGVITEVSLKTLPFNPRTTLLVGYFSNLDKAGEAVRKLAAVKPGAIEFVDRSLLQFYQNHRPGDLQDLVPADLPRIMLLVEFDDYSQLSQALRSRRAEQVLKRHGAQVRVSTDPIEQVALWKLRRDAPALLALTSYPRKPLPFIEDAAVPASRLAEFIDKTYRLLVKHDLEAPMWGHAGDGQLHLLPLIDLSRRREVDHMFSFGHEFYDMVLAMGGTISAEHNDGLLRASYLQKQYGKDMMELMRQTKQICDPHDVLNPTKKTQATEAYAREHLRASYNLKHLYEHI